MITVILDDGSELDLPLNMNLYELLQRVSHDKSNSSSSQIIIKPPKAQDRWLLDAAYRRSTQRNTLSTQCKAASLKQEADRNSTLHRITTLNNSLLIIEAENKRLKDDVIKAEAAVSQTLSAAMELREKNLEAKKAKLRQIKAQVLTKQEIARSLAEKAKNDLESIDTIVSKYNSTTSLYRKLFPKAKQLWRQDDELAASMSDLEREYRKKRNDYRDQSEKLLKHINDSVSESYFDQNMMLQLQEKLSKLNQRIASANQKLQFYSREDTVKPEFYEK